MNDQFYINRTLKLAQKGLGKTSPNPMVGAVIVKNGKIIGEGFHKEFGSIHAEIDAIKNSTNELKDSTLYVNLEPCNHQGNTPPCTDIIIKSGIKKLICSSIDPNPKVNGHGILKLKKAGIEVISGILENESQRLNEQFFTFHKKKRPFVALKFATSLDGKIATVTGDSKWITNDKSRQYARLLRREFQSIMVGINTILNDDPHLGASIPSKFDPLRIILDSKLRIPVNSKVLRNDNVLIVTTKFADQKKLLQLTKSQIEVLILPNETIEIKSLLIELYKRNIISIFVEGGGNLHGSFIDNKILDKVYAFQAPILIGGENAPSAIRGKGNNKITDVIRLKTIQRKNFDDNSLIIGYVD